MSMKITLLKTGFKFVLNAHNFCVSYKGSYDCNLFHKDKDFIRNLDLLDGICNLHFSGLNTYLNFVSVANSIYIF